MVSITTAPRAMLSTIARRRASFISHGRSRTVPIQASDSSNSSRNSRRALIAGHIDRFHPLETRQTELQSRFA
jgi:hypothetical protein